MSWLSASSRRRRLGRAGKLLSDPRLQPFRLRPRKLRNGASCRLSAPRPGTVRPARKSSVTAEGGPPAACTSMASSMACCASMGCVDRQILRCVEKFGWGDTSRNDCPTVFLLAVGT